MGHSFSLLTAALLVGQTPIPDGAITNPNNNNGKTCPCKNGMQPGMQSGMQPGMQTLPGMQTQSGSQTRVYAMPDGGSETRTTSWWSWRSSSSSSSSSTTSSAPSTNGTVVTSGPMTTTTPSAAPAPAVEVWRNGSQPASEGSWIDNRPVLSRIRNWFGRGDNNNQNNMQRIETNQPMRGTVIDEPPVSDYYRRLPTTNEPPLGAPGQTVPVQQIPVQPVPIQPRPITPSGAQNGAAEQPLTIELEPIVFRPAGQSKGAGVVNASTPLIAPQADPIVPANQVVVPPSRPNPINSRFTNKVGQPGDYSWITGQLEIRGNTYIVHYATPETVDRYNGSVVLQGAANLQNLRSGDLVSAHGVIMDSGRGVVYRVSAVDLVER